MNAAHRNARDWLGTALIIIPIASFVIYWVSLFFSLAYFGYVFWLAAFLIIASAPATGVVALIFRKSNRQRMRLAIAGLIISLTSLVISGLMTNCFNRIGTKAKVEHELRIQQEAEQDVRGNADPATR